MSVYILDVRLPETFERGHVPDSVSNPVFQIGFLDRMPADWSKTDPIQVIGEDAESQEAQVAAEKLSRAGYTEVAILEGGYQAWRTAHDGSEAPAETP
ncbi:MAG: rhodanese-like domain-containing protein, partial [Kiritimatiellia bacterium]